MMTTRITNILVASSLLAASVAACRHRQSLPTAETPTLDVTDWTDKTELFMEYPPLVAGQDRALCGASDADARLQAGDGRPGDGRVHAGSRRPSRPRSRDRNRRGRARSGWKAPRPPRDAIAGRSVLDAPGLSDRHDLGTVTVFADEKAALAEAARQPAGRCRRDRVFEGTAVDERVRDGAGAGDRGADVDPRAGDGRRAAGRRGHRLGAGAGTISRRHAARRGRSRDAPGRPSDAWSRG